MAGSLLDSLNPRQRAAYPIIQKGVTDGLSANVIGNVLRAAGIPIRRATMLDLVAAERIEQGVGITLSNLPKSTVINPTRLPVAQTKIRRAFSFTVRVEGSLTDTDQPWEQYVTVTTSKLMSVREIEDAAIEAAEAGIARYGMTVDRATIIRGVRAGGAGSFS